ncbi:regulator of volume decrease after cellular swelling-domain-containing protein [Mrakia frigida]|uniref:Voldacs domain-containing protein n=1 Tax=Mrakia frigida TaxID=29902 RepID=UPI003FCC2408
MLSPISQPPRFISQENWNALTSETPSSFASIPPIIRHQQENVTITFSPDWEGYGEQGLKGTLFVTEEALSFLPTASTSGFTLPYPSITLHAISRDNAALGPCVYCQLDESVQPDAGAALPVVERENDGHYHPEDDEEADTPMREMRIFVGEESLEPIFLSLSHCASLHPSIFDAVDGMSDDEGIYADPSTFEPFTGEDGEELSAVGRAALAHLESILVWPVGQGPNAAAEDAVEDAEEEQVEESKEEESKPVVNGK